MSVSAASSLFHAATAILTSPAAQLSGFSLANTAPAASAKPPAQHLHDRTQSGLLQLQQDAQSGALANGLDQIIGGAA
ncbi:MAG TPA: hypothetical protein VL154_16175 [Acetobacteraceae bacterium]|jgi:hypothetical protein|nr:hypothetical protein [Acetobacteraceae bacterium]